MRALTLDFRRQTRSRWAGVVLLVAGIAGAVVIGSQYQEVVDAVAGAESGMRGHGLETRKQVVASRAGGDVQNVALEVKRAREIVLQLSMPWNELFTSIEATDTQHVALLGIESDIDKQRVKISAEARNLDAMLGFIRDLQGRPALAEVYLQSHQIQPQDPQHPVRFVLTATWLARK